MNADNWMVSPHFNMNQLRRGEVQPIDVFEDAINGWILQYAAKLADLNEPDAGMAVLNLIAAYPETIECYLAGKDSRGALKDFFTRGLKRVFPELTATMPDEALSKICDDLRTGLYHSSMLKGSVVLVPEGRAVEYLPDQKACRVNPFEFFRGVQEHFAAYVARLRAATGGDELRNFRGCKKDCVNGHPRDHTQETRWLSTSNSSTSCWRITRSQKTSLAKTVC